ncbi:MAG: hypothetical protein AB7O88_02505 [Reyranellaceae bacterium]
MSTTTRTSLALCLALAGAGCADEPRPPSRDPRPLPITENVQSRAALVHWLNCTDRHIARLENRKSPSQPLALIVADRCRSEFEAFVDASAQGFNNADRAELRRRMVGWDSSRIEMMIVARRRSR